MSAEQIQSQIEKLRRTAETGEQWAEICRLEALAVAEQMAEETRDIKALTVPEINLAKQIDTFGATALVIKMQRDTLADALRDIRMGADMMLQPACNLTGSIRGYVLEVKRVATEGLKEAQLL